MKGMLGSVKFLLALTICCLIFGVYPARAVDVTINITGEIRVSTCRINSDTEIQVSFGEMSLYDVDGQKNAQTKTVTVDCDSDQGTPYIRIDGTVLQGAGDNVLQTTGANSSTLGIALYQGEDVNTTYPLMTGAGEGQYGYKITRGLTIGTGASGTFTFTAVPMKYGSDALTAGMFSATATMSINYL
ncbi:TPA: fimbrial protein [Escherichia coli]|nr:fimbrial protein [Escherichia coli]